MIFPTQVKDIFFAIAFYLLTITLVLIKGDALYVGIWYYFAVPMAALSIAAFFKPKPFFQTGVATGITLIFLTYLCINWGASKPEGMLGLGHLFSLPGAIIGLLYAANSLKKYNSNILATAFIFGLSGILIGFLINQLLVCNTLMWCGPLSFPVN